jgi:hypothetical protein
MCAGCNLVLHTLFFQVPLARVLKCKALLISHFASKSSATSNADIAIVLVQ